MADIEQDKPDAEKVEAEVLSLLVNGLQRVDGDARARILGAVSVFFKFKAEEPGRAPAATEHSATGYIDVPNHRFSDDRTPSPRQFLSDKKPRTDVERITALAYYLTHYRDTKEFKTADLSALNAEAGQPKFGNAAQVVDNATKGGYLLPTKKGQKQIAALGEVYVEHLPDQERAKAIANEHRPRRKAR